MARGRKTSLTIRLTPAERQTLQAWQRATTIPAGRACRGRIILLLAEGMPTIAIAATVGISRRMVWRPCTPAMAAGWTDHVWSLTEMLLYWVPPWPQLRTV